ncbi:MAG TPA: hypothetical protein VEZ47_04440, partial [Gemmatirosa sp.]|nr:hypothetical protein [Gemmatirosa sp.]
GPALDPAPLATTVAALGPPTPPPGADRPGSRAPGAPPLPGDAWLLGGAIVAVLAEVASRRLRGAR